MLAECGIVAKWQIGSDVFCRRGRVVRIPGKGLCKCPLPPVVSCARLRNRQERYGIFPACSFADDPKRKMEEDVKKIFYLILTGCLVFALAGCKDETPKSADQTPAQPQTAPMAQGKAGTVVETMNSGGYTYVQVDTGSEKIWAAAPEFVVAVGDAVIVPEGMLMENHTSKSLNRTFEKIYFVESIAAPGAAAAAAPADAADHSRPVVTAGDIDVSGVKKAAGGQTVADVYGNKAALAGKEIAVRGKVVKFSQQIMGTNWIHVQDGTGAAGTNDLTVTTDAVVKAGDTVLVKGVLVADKDFGFGYKYDVIIEKAAVTVE